MALTQQKILDAEEDLNDLAAIINGPADADVQTRTGGVVPTLKKRLAPYDNAGAVAAAAQDAKTTALQAAADAGVYRDQANVSAGVANNHAANADASEASAIAARDAAIGARDSSIAARDAALGYRDEAWQNKELAVQAAADADADRIAADNARVAAEAAAAVAQAQTMPEADFVRSTVGTALLNSQGILSFAYDNATKKINVTVGIATDADAFDKLAYIGGDGGMAIGSYLDFHSADNDGTDFRARISATANGNLVIDPINELFIEAETTWFNGSQILIQHSGGHGYIRTQVGNLSIGSNGTNQMSFFNGSIGLSSPMVSYVAPMATAIDLCTNDGYLGTRVLRNTNAAQPGMFIGYMGQGNVSLYPGGSLPIATVTAAGLTLDTAADFYVGTERIVRTGKSNTFTIEQKFTNGGSILASTAYPGIQAYTADPAQGAHMAFHRSGAYAIYFGLDPDNWVRLGGWSSGVRASFGPAGELTIGSTLDCSTPNNGTTGGLRLRGNGTSGQAIIQITDAPVTAQWGYWLHTNVGQADWYGGAGLKDNGGRVLSHADTSLPGGKITVSTAAPSGGQDGDIWLVVT